MQNIACIVIFDFPSRISRWPRPVFHCYYFTFLFLLLSCVTHRRHLISARSCTYNSCSVLLCAEQRTLIYQSVPAHRRHTRLCALKWEFLFYTYVRMILSLNFGDLLENYPGFMCEYLNWTFFVLYTFVLLYLSLGGLFENYAGFLCDIYSLYTYV